MSLHIYVYYGTTPGGSLEQGFKFKRLGRGKTEFGVGDRKTLTGFKAGIVDWAPVRLTKLGVFWAGVVSSTEVTWVTFGILKSWLQLDFKGVAGRNEFEIGRAVTWGIPSAVLSIDICVASLAGIVSTEPTGMEFVLLTTCCCLNAEIFSGFCDLGGCNFGRSVFDDD